MQSDHSKKEEEILASWEQKEIFKKTLAKESPMGPFVFFEGPPTANGKPGIHHAESRAFKDVIPRFRTMQGYRVERKGGWDTHGLPVELEVEKQLGFTGKAQIEAYGITQFNRECKASVSRYLEDWNTFTRRLGFWVDLEKPYYTYESSYVESLWWIIKQVWDQDLLYKDYRITPHCPRCGTSLSSHELAQGYKDVKDLSVTAAFELADEPGTFVLAWTTTPWTLPGNVGLAVGETIDYVKAKQGERFFWLAKERLEMIEGEHEIVEEQKGSALVGRAYKPLYPYLEQLIADDQKEALEQKAYRIYAADFVTTQDGTGVVHTAVMYGADDFVLGTQVGLPKQHLVDLDGNFVQGMDFLAGRFVADETVAIDIIKDLAHRGLLFAKAKYEHSYPHCWRCKTKVIYYAKDSWYIRMSALRSELLAANETVHWEPSHIQNGRFGEWLREVKDWAFSRERYWGTPLPIWESKEGDVICVGSYEQLRAFAKDPSALEGEFDPHRPFIDDVILEKDGKEYTRVKDVCDVWFDAGSMPYAQHHYPFENKELIDSGNAFPADYICEAIDQTRGWFYTLMAVSVLLKKGSPYKNVICLGHVLDAEGKKMSKSLGNIVEPMAAMETYGADAVRWYMYTVNQPGESKRFDEKMLQDMIRKNFTILLNVVSFYELFADARAPEPVESTQVLDVWIRARLAELVTEVTDGLEGYKITEPARAIGDFITDLSTWYVRRSRDRFKGEDEQDKVRALYTLSFVLDTLSKLLAPFVPFLAEQVYARAGGKQESVHLEDWPSASVQPDQIVLSHMERVRALTTRGLEARATTGINVRQALATLTLSDPGVALPEEYVTLIKDEINVKDVVFVVGEPGATLDTTLTPELKREGLVREMIRFVNAMRKQQGLTLDDRIELVVCTQDDDVKAALQDHREELLAGTLAHKVDLADTCGEIQDTLTLSEISITLGFNVIPR